MELENQTYYLTPGHFLSKLDQTSNFYLTKFSLRI